MIQENYKLSLEQNEDCSIVLPKLENLLENIRQSEHYQKSSSVYIKLLMARIPTESAATINRMVARMLPRAVVIGVSLTLFGLEAEAVFLTLNCSFFEQATVALLEHNGCPCHYKTFGSMWGRWYWM